MTSEQVSRGSLFSLQPRERLACFVVLQIAFVCVFCYRLSIPQVVDVGRWPAYASRPFQLDLNQADWTEFALLPGIGETLAKRIVSRRKSLGGFRHIDELLEVKGIGPRKLMKLRPFVLLD